MNFQLQQKLTRIINEALSNANETSDDVRKVVEEAIFAANLFMRRCHVAHEWFEQSDLNGFQIEDANCWENIGDNQLARTIFVAPDSPAEDNGSIRKRLSVHFKSVKEDVIDHANIDGIELTIPRHRHSISPPA